jgi:chromosome segregation ATPase
MTSHIGVHSVDSLKQFRTAMVRFQADAAAALDQAEGVVRDAIARLQELRRCRSDEVRKCQDEVEDAKSELRNCESSGDEDECPDCREFEHAIRQAERRLQEARHDLHAVEGSLRSTEQTASHYRQEARKLRQQLTQDWAKASTRLESDINHLQTYASGPPEAAPPESV